MWQRRAASEQSVAGEAKPSAQSEEAARAEAWGRADLEQPSGESGRLLCRPRHKNWGEKGCVFQKRSRLLLFSM